jgi:hypothetical protein
VGLALPCASLAWLHGGHVTPEQEALHEHADALGILHHHGDAEPHDHPDADSVRVSLVPHGPELTPPSTVNLLPNDTVQSIVAGSVLTAPAGFRPRIPAVLQLIMHSVDLPHPKVPPRLSPNLA